MKRTCALFVGAVLLVALFLPMAGAEPSVLFVAVEYTVFDLSPAHTPIYADSLLYAPLSVMVDNDLDLHMLTSKDNRTLSLYKKTKMLTFDVESGLSYDSTQQYSYKLLKQSGITYVPVDAVCSYFGLSYKMLTSESGPVLHLRAENSSLSDKNFLSAATPVLKEKLDNYAASSSPDVSPSPTPPVRRIIYITIDDGPSAKGTTEQMLDTLDKFGVKATFFLLGSNLTKNEDAVRRIVGSGHAVGLHSYSHDPDLFYASTDSMRDELKKTNDLLDRIVNVKTRLVRLPFGSSPYMKAPGYCEAISDGGYRFWDWNIDGDPTVGAEKVNTPEEIAAHIISELSKPNAHNPAYLLIHDRKKTADALPAILSYLSNNNFVFAVCTESERPYNYMHWIQ